jgi:ABC-type sugar transport system permease subunit
VSTDERGGVPRGAPPLSRIGWGFWARLVGLGLLAALGVFAVPVLIGQQAWGMLTSLLVGMAFITWVYLSPRTRALRWITPGLVLMAVFVVWPILYTFFVATTNWSTGNILSKDQAIQRLEDRRFLPPDEEARVYDLLVFQDDAGELRFWIETVEGDVFFGEPRLRSDPKPDEPTLEDPGALGVIDEDGDGVPDLIGPYRRLEIRQLFVIADRIERLVLDVPDGEVQALTINRARLFAQSRVYSYDASRDVLSDHQRDMECVADIGNFVCPDGRRLEPGWREVIGLKNFTDVITNPRIRQPFLSVFTWNIVFAGMSVILTLTVGLLLALALQDGRMRGKFVYRSIFIIPYAIPGFISVLVWRGLLNTRFGQLNDFLQPLFDLFGSDRIPWLSHGTWAKVAVLIVNTWLGFPYMFLITTGALQAIPDELRDAAKVDGATGIQGFRKVTFPLLMVSIAPLLIGSFAFNFNNFVLIFLLTNGGPPILDSAVPVGETDILISFTFKVAVQAGRGNNFGMGAAITIAIFFMVMLISAFGFRRSKRYEEIYGSL